MLLTALLLSYLTVVFSFLLWLPRIFLKVFAQWLQNALIFLLVEIAPYNGLQTSEYYLAYRYGFNPSISDPSIHIM